MAESGPRQVSISHELHARDLIGGLNTRRAKSWISARIFADSRCRLQICTLKVDKASWISGVSTGTGIELLWYVKEDLVLSRQVHGCRAFLTNAFLLHRFKLFE